MRRLTILSRTLGLTLLVGLSALTPGLSAAPLLHTSLDDQGQLATTMSPAPSAVEGDAATQRLKAQGQYESLAQAAQAARYAVGAADCLPAGGPAESGYYAGNPAQALRCWFRAGGLELQPSGPTPWKLNLRLVGYGRATLETAEVNALNADQHRVELSRANGMVVEWYENRPAGLEQGFTLHRPPRGEGRLRVVLAAEGDLWPQLEPAEPPSRPRSGDSGEHRQLADPAEEMRRSAELPLRRPGAERASAVNFVTGEGQAALRYSGLKVWDAAQRPLPAHLEVQGRQVVLVADDHAAAYPVTIDPLITCQEAELVAVDQVAHDWFGVSASLSADGDTALVGASGDYTAERSVGSAYVFVRSGGGWSLQTKLTSSDGATYDQFGWSVSLSGDGNMALVGARGDDTTGGTLDVGSVYVFVRRNGSWSQQAKLTAGSGNWGAEFGSSVSLNWDGSTAFIGSPSEVRDWAYAAGRAYVFVRSGSSWSMQAGLRGDGREYDRFGSAVSLSDDGNTALVGAYGADTPAAKDTGSGYVFVRDGGTWTLQAQLMASDGAAGDQFGCSASLSRDGQTALVGANAADTQAGGDVGSGYVFVRSGGTWVQQVKLTPEDGAAYDWFGSSVCLNADGNTAIVGITGNDPPAGTGDAGGAYVFVRNGANWTEQAKLTSVNGSARAYLGYSVSLNGDGNTALVGACGADTLLGTNAGSAHLFERNGSSWVSQASLGPSADDCISRAFGGSVSLSGDGNTALVGAYDCTDTAFRGLATEAYVFARKGNAWALEAKLADGLPWSGKVGGYSVSLSADGNTALVGAPEVDYFMYPGPSVPSVGIAFVFVRNGNTWVCQAHGFGV